MSDKSIPIPPTIRRAGHFLFIAGLNGVKDDGTFDKRTPWPREDDLHLQTLQAIRNLEKILQEAGGNLSSVVELSGYVVSPRDKNDQKCFVEAFERAIAQGFGSHAPPACTPVIVDALPPNIWVLIKATAYLPVEPT
jgi:2-aminomuconate deaminase